MSIAARLRSFLDERHVTYRVIEHRPTYTAMEIAQTLHVPGREMAKVVIVKADDRYCMVVLPAPYKVDLEAFRRSTGAQRAELATEGEMQRLFPDCEVGAMPPFGNLYGMPVYAERSLTEDREIVFEGGNHHEAVCMAYDDFERAVHPIVMDFRMVD